MTAQDGPPAVAILTVTTNAARHLPAYIEALCAISYPRWELWVVDNASEDGSPDLVEARIPRARVLRNERNLGFTGACNRALREILAMVPGPDYVLFLNDDTEVTPGFLEPLVGRANERVLVAPRTCLAPPGHGLDDSVGEFDWLRGAWRERVLGRSPAANEAARPVSNANLSALLVPLGAFRALGVLDDAFFVYYDDTDFCRRAGDAGYEIWLEPRSLVYHRKGATLGGQLSDFGCYYLARNRPYLIRKHEPLHRFAAFLAYYLATRSARSAIWLAQGRRDLVAATWRGIADFARGRMGERRESRPSPNR